MERIFSMAYSILGYIIGVAALVYLILFIADWPFIPDNIVPVTVNKGYAATQLDMGAVTAAFWNAGLISIWSLQHSYMAGPKFKQNLSGIVPPAIERSTYMIFVGLFTAILILLWQPLPSLLWDVSGTPLGTALVATFILGWVIVLYSTFLINHFHLFGLQQAFVHLTERETKQASFVMPALYKLVRHPMMLGVIIAIWSIPTLTIGRLILTVGLTVYVWLGLRHEEETLAAELGKSYKDYQKTTPMVIPFLKP